MMDFRLFKNAVLCGGFTIVQIGSADEPLVDAAGREATARTWIIGRKLYMDVRAGLDEKECSVTLYHEVLEAMTVAVASPPVSVMEFNEGDFERAGCEAFDRFGAASPENLNLMLQSYGFRED